MKSLYLVFCLMGLFVFSQNREIEFNDGNWKTQLATAKKENKLIFFDVYTSWCGPCKLMAKNVFTKDSVADLFNESFINFKQDMEKGEGVFLKDFYEVTAFPTYLFIDGNGNLIHKIVGSMSASKFIGEANNALNPENTLYALKKNFEAKPESEEYAIAYLKALSIAYESNKMSSVSKTYFDTLEESKLLEKPHWELAVKYLNNPSSKAYAYLFNNKHKLKNHYNADDVKNYFQRVFSRSVYRIKDAYESKTDLEVAKENSKAIKRLLKEKTSYSKMVLAKLDLIEYAYLGQWDEFSAKVEAIITDSTFTNKNYVVIEASHDVVTANQDNLFKSVMHWADQIEQTQPKLFTQIQLAELRKKVLKHQGKSEEADLMYQKEKDLRKEAAEKRLVTPPLRND